MPKGRPKKEVEPTEEPRSERVEEVIAPEPEPTTEYVVEKGYELQSNERIVTIHGRDYIEVTDINIGTKYLKNIDGSPA